MGSKDRPEHQRDKQGPPRNTAGSPSRRQTKPISQGHSPFIYFNFIILIILIYLFIYLFIFVHLIEGTSCYEPYPKEGLLHCLCLISLHSPFLLLLSTLLVLIALLFFPFLKERGEGLQSAGRITT